MPEKKKTINKDKEKEETKKDVSSVNNNKDKKENNKKNKTTAQSKKTSSSVKKEQVNEKNFNKKEISSKDSTKKIEEKKENVVEEKQVTIQKEDDKKETAHEEPKEDLKEETKKDEEVVVEKAQTTTNNEKHQKKKENNKLPIKLIIILAIVFIAITAFLVSYVFIFPFNANSVEDGKTKTRNGILDFNVKISANKPILKILYAIDPKDEKDKKLYAKLKTDGSLFSKEVKFKDLSIPSGKHQLCFYVESILGTKDTTCINIEYDIGYIGVLNPSNIKKVSDKTYIISDELIITFDSSISSKRVKEILEKVNGEIVGELYYANIYQVKITGNLNDTKKTLEQEEDIIDVSYNYLLKDKLDVNEVFYNKVGDFRLSGELHISKNYHLSYIEADKAYKEVKNPSIINVGLIDAPIDYRHHELNINKNSIYIPQLDMGSLDNIDDILSLYKKYDHNSSDRYYNDDINGCAYLGFRSHGTHVAGIMSAKHDGDGIDGINDNVNLFYASHWYYFNKDDIWDKLSDSAKEYYGSNDGILAYTGDTFSLSYALSNLIMSDVRVINMSVSLTDYNDNEYTNYKKYLDNFFEVIKKTAKDFLIVKSAGNDYGKNATHDLYNRILSENKFMKNRTIIVGASSSPGLLNTNNTNMFVVSRANYSNIGEIVDIFAPGAIYSSIYNSDYEWMIGTSQATPLVAGTASLLYSYNPNFKAEDVKQMIVKNTKKTLAVDKRKYGILNTYLALQAAKEFEKTNTIPTTKDETKYGFIQGAINDAKTNKPPTSNGTIRFIDVNDSSKVYVAADSDACYLTNGNYDFILPIGTYNMEVEFAGYVNETIYNLKITEETTTYNILLKIVNTAEKKGNGYASGYVVDAFNGEHIKNAKIKIYRGISNSTRDLVTELTSDESGSYKVELEPGNYTAYVSAENYTSGKSNILILPEETTNNQNCTITPVLKEGEIRAILTWGELPRDLDSHLVGPTPDGSRFHIYYSNKNYYYNNIKYDNLDIDDTSSYGPETTSVYVGVNGTYTYYVHNFSNRSSKDTNALSLSGAQVKLYKAGVEEPIVFNVPNKPGTLWKVFSIKNGEIIIHNEMSYHENQSTIGN